MKLYLFLVAIAYISCNQTEISKAALAAATGKETALPNFDSVQIAMVQQQAWENLAKVPGTERDYSTTIRLRIANGNIIDADCQLIFKKDSWAIASIIVDEYKGVLKNTSTKIFAVFYKLITDPGIRASEINITGLWRPWLGSHVHIEGRGIDIGSIRSSMGSGVIFNFGTSGAENAFAKTVRQTMTTNFPVVTQYLSPWFICNPSSACSVNNGQTQVESKHRDHLHLTLRP